VKPGRSILLLEKPVDERAGVLVVDDRDHELHGREYRSRESASRDASAQVLAGDHLFD
jgi:hypothetical protein